MDPSYQYFKVPFRRDSVEQLTEDSAEFTE